MLLFYFREDDPTSKLSTIVDNVIWFHGVVGACYIAWPLIPGGIWTLYIYLKFVISVPLMIVSALLLQFLIVKNIFTCNQEKQIRPYHRQLTDCINMDAGYESSANSSGDEVFYADKRTHTRSYSTGQYIQLNERLDSGSSMDSLVSIT